MESFVDHSEVENEVGKDGGQKECNSVENAEHRAPRIQNPKNRCNHWCKHMCKHGFVQFRGGGAIRIKCKLCLFLP